MSERPSHNQEPIESRSNHAFFTSELSNGVRLEVYTDKILVMLENARCYLTDEGFSYDLHSDLVQAESTRQKIKLDQRKVFEIVTRVRNILLSKRWCINTPGQSSHKKIDQLTNDELIELAELTKTAGPLPMPPEPNFPASRPSRAE